VLDLRVSAHLQLFHAVPGPLGRDRPEALGADSAFDLALVLGAVRGAGVDVEAHGTSVGPVAGVELAPGAGAVYDGGLGVVDANDGEHGHLFWWAERDIRSRLMMV